MKRVDVHPDAAADLLRLVDQISELSTAAASGLIEQYESVIVDLERFPEIGRASSSSPGSRVLVRRGFLYWYEVRDEVVVLYAIEDGRNRTEPL